MLHQTSTVRSSSTVPLEVQTWKAQVKQLSEPEAEFEKWLLVTLAGVLFADKAGELLALQPRQFGLTLERRLGRLQLLADRWQLSVAILHQTRITTKVIIVNDARVKKALDQVPCQLLCGQLNYGPQITPGQFVAEMGRRWRASGQIPHEIGLALGYPVKDVLGFMELLPLDNTACCGWRVYGDPKPSLQKSQAFQKARQLACVFTAI